MHVRKRNGRLEPVDVNKIVRAVQRSAGGLPHVDIMRIAVKTIGGLFDGATTRELDRLSIQTAASLIAEEPEYSQLAARLLDCYIDKEVMNQDIHSFSQAIAAGHRLGLDRRRDRPVRRGGRPQAERGRGPAVRPVRVLRPAHGLRPLPAPPPDHRATSSRRPPTSSCGWPAGCREP